MLAPEDRRLYSACFGAPLGHVFDCAVGTTFSLDLDSLLFALFGLATSGSVDPEAALGDPVSLLEAIHRVSSRVSVFCHAGETSAPQRPQALYGLLEECLVPAVGRGGGIFHPKLWLLRFRAVNGGEPLLRAVVLSRNMTTSRAWDTFVCLEGAPERRRVEDSRGLAALVRALPGLCVPGHAVSQDRSELLEGLAHDAERTTFPAPSPFEAVAHFVALGVAEGRPFEPSLKGNRVFAMSPFVSPDALSRLRELAPRGELIGRAEEMAKCGRDVIEAWEAFVLHDGVSADADCSGDEEELATADAAPQGLHAKALAVESGQRTTWWLGSGNLTDPVLAGTSVELLVRLEGKTSRVGIEAFLDAGFSSLRVPYRYAPLEEDEAEGNRAKVDRAKRRIGEAGLALRCKNQDQLWSLVLEGGGLELDGVTVSCRPVTLPPSRALRWRSGTDRYCFEHLSIEALSAFLILEVSAGQGPSLFEACFTLKLPITGLPIERDAQIARSIIKDRVAFMSYLRHLLADLGEGVGGLDAERMAAAPETAASSRSVSSGLLEAVLRALHRHPERLSGLRKLLEQTAADGAEGSPVPAEFRELWAAVEPHLPPLEAAR